MHGAAILASLLGTPTWGPKIQSLNNIKNLVTNYFIHYKKWFMGEYRLVQIYRPGYNWRFVHVVLLGRYISPWFLIRTINDQLIEKSENKSFRNIFLPLLSSVTFIKYGWLFPLLICREQSRKFFNQSQSADAKPM